MATAVHPMASAFPRPSATEDSTATTAGTTTTPQAPKVTVTINDDTLKKPQLEQPQQRQRWTTLRSDWAQNVRQVYEQARLKATEALPESIKNQEWKESARQAYDTTRTKLNDARESEQWQKVTSTVASNWELAQSKAKHMMFKDNDPTHSKETMEILSASFSELQTFLGKVWFLFVMFAHFLFFALPDRLLHLVGLRNNTLPGKFQLTRLDTTPAIWVGEYVMPVGSSNTVIIQGKDGKLLIRSPPEPTTHVVQAIRNVGEPSAFLLSVSHDTFGDRWKQLFPNAQIVAMRDDIITIGNRVRVERPLEDATEILENFNIERVISTSEWSRGEEPILILDLGQGRRGAVFGCGFTGPSQASTIFSPVYWRDFLLGRTCLGVLPAFAYVFGRKGKDAEAQRTWHEIAETPGLDTLIFLHGRPVVGDKNLKAQMYQVNLSKLKLAV